MQTSSKHAPGATAVGISAALGAEVTTITSCPSQPTIPVKFVVDCSLVQNAATRQLCTPFIVKQACKVFPAYRKMTGIRLEQRCPILTYKVARVIIESELYLASSKNVYLFYSRLATVAPSDAADREARHNAMLNDISGGKAKEFLTALGCARF